MPHHDEDVRREQEKCDQEYLDIVAPRAPEVGNVSAKCPLQWRQTQFVFLTQPINGQLISEMYVWLFLTSEVTGVMP